MLKNIKIIFGVFALAGIISYFILDANEKQFNEKQWHENPLTRYKMSKDIVQSNILYGKSKYQIMSLLGKPIPSSLEGKEHFVYSLGKPPGFFEAKKETLIVIFDNEKVSNVIHRIK